MPHRHLGCQRAAQRMAGHDPLGIGTPALVFSLEITVRAFDLVVAQGTVENVGQAAGISPAEGKDAGNRHARRTGLRSRRILLEDLVIEALLGIFGRDRQAFELFEHRACVAEQLLVAGIGIGRGEGMGKGIHRSFANKGVPPARLKPAGGARLRDVGIGDAGRQQDRQQRRCHRPKRQVLTPFALRQLSPSRSFPVRAAVRPSEARGRVPCRS